MIGPRRVIVPHRNRTRGLGGLLCAFYNGQDARCPSAPPRWRRSQLGLPSPPRWRRSQLGLPSPPRWRRSQLGLPSPPRWRRSQLGRLLDSVGASHRRKSFKILAKTSYQDKNAVKRVVFVYTGMKGCHILSLFGQTFCVRKVTDCAIEFDL